jgi:hypothetical protein
MGLVSRAKKEHTHAVDFSRLLRLSGNVKRKEHSAKRKPDDFSRHVFSSISIHL